LGELGLFQSRAGAIDASLANLREAQRALAYAAPGDQEMRSTRAYIRIMVLLQEVLSRFTTHQDESTAIGTQGLAVIEHVLRLQPANYPNENGVSRFVQVPSPRSFNAAMFS
jgi:hypothetical protein